MPNTKVYDCPNCGQAQLQPSITGTLLCPNCGSEYDPPAASIADNIFERIELQKADRFSLRAAGVAELKAKEEADSQQRLEAMWADERKRQEQLAAQLAERKRQEAQMMRSILVVLAVIGLVLLIGLIVLATR